MKNDKEKDFENTYEIKIQDIKNRKRKLRHIQDPKMVKKIKEDLKREQRGLKRSEKNNLKEWIKKQLENG